MMNVQPHQLVDVIEANHNDQSLNKTILEEEGVKEEFLAIIQKFQFRDDIPQDELQKVIGMKMDKVLTVQIVFTEDSLENMQPNLKAIQQYQEKKANLESK